MAGGLTKRQEEFIQALMELGLSQMVVATIASAFQEEEVMMEMAVRLIEAEDNGEKITDQVALRIFCDILNEAEIK